FFSAFNGRPDYEECRSTAIGSKDVEYWAGPVAGPVVEGKCELATTFVSAPANRLGPWQFSAIEPRASERGTDESSRELQHARTESLVAASLSPFSPAQFTQ